MFVCQYACTDVSLSGCMFVCLQDCDVMAVFSVQLWVCTLCIFAGCDYMYVCP